MVAKVPLSPLLQKHKHALSSILIEATLAGERIIRREGLINQLLDDSQGLLVALVVQLDYALRLFRLLEL